MSSAVLLVDKPAGITSHDVVASVRRELGRSVKVGHAGTLDPFATGLLIVLTGRATRTQRLFMQLAKSYEVTARFGAVSTTGDTEGSITETGRVPEGDLELPEGNILQRPPAFSAVKVDGVRAYRLARAGVEVELDERPVTVHEFTEIERESQTRRFRIRCSSGTYVRSLIADLGDAHCTALRRTAIGPFDVPAEDPVELTLVDALARFMPRLEVDPLQARDLGHGKVVSVKGDVSGRTEDGLSIATCGESLIAVVGWRGDDSLRTVIGFSGL